MTPNALTRLAGALAEAAAELEQGNVYERAWGRHFREDRKAVLMLAAADRHARGAAGPAEVVGRG